MSTMGIGQGLNEGVQTAGQFIMQGLQLKQRKELAQKSLDADIEWKRAWAGLGPSYEDEEQAQPAAQGAGMPQIGTGTQPPVTGGRLDFGMTTYKPTITMPNPPSNPTSPPGAMGLIPPSMGYTGRPPRMRRPPY